MANRLLKHGLTRVPGLKRLPVLKLIVLAEIALLARDHLGKLEPHERRRLLALVRKGRARRNTLPEDERAELAALLAKAEPRLFMGVAADKLSPVRLPRRIVHGPKRH